MGTFRSASGDNSTSELPVLQVELMHARVRSLRHRVLLSLDGEAGLRVTAGSVIMEEQEDDAAMVLVGRLELI